MENQKKQWEKRWKSGKIGEDFIPTKFSQKAFNSFKNKNFKSLLDIGCGNGRDSLYFAKKGLDVTSIDFSEEAISRLNDKISSEKIKNMRSLVMNIKNLKLKKSFDVIYANLSLHYFGDKELIKIFSKIYALLNHGGMLFVRCKSTKDPRYGKGEKIEKDMFLFNGVIRHLFSKKYLLEKLKDFKIIEIRETSSKHNTLEKNNVSSNFTEAIAIKI